VIKHNEAGIALMTTKPCSPPMTISVLSDDCAIPTTMANDRQPMTSYSCSVVAVAQSRLVFEILTM